MRVTGTKLDLEFLLSELQHETGLDLDIAGPHPAGVRLLDRRRQHYSEVWEIVLSVGLGVAGNAAYDAIRAVIHRLRRSAPSLAETRGSTENA